MLWKVEVGFFRLEFTLKAGKGEGTTKLTDGARRPFSFPNVLRRGSREDGRAVSTAPRGIHCASSTALRQKKVCLFRAARGREEGRKGGTKSPLDGHGHGGYSQRAEGAVRKSTSL